MFHIQSSANKVRKMIDVKGDSLYMLNCHSSVPANYNLLQSIKNNRLKQDCL
jgi:hypothetical protein